MIKNLIINDLPLPVGAITIDADTFSEFVNWLVNSDFVIKYFKYLFI